MRLRTVKSAHSVSYNVIKTAYINKKRTTVTVEKLGNEKYICETYGVSNALEWAKEHVAMLNKKALEEESKMDISFSQSIPMNTDRQNSFNIGYLFLQKIFYDLGFDNICNNIKRKHKYDYDLTSILSRLLYSRIIYPSSKKSTFELSKNFIEEENFELHHMYKALSLLAKESDYVQSALYKNTVKYSKRKTGIIYYDCTNYYFETEKEEGIKKYGVSKEHRPNPIVQMGLFMDREGIPLAFSINPGNTNEQTTLRPLENKLKTDFNLSKFVVCTDMGLSSSDNKKYNSKEERAYINAQSIKKLKEYQKEWCLDNKGWYKLGERNKKDKKEDKGKKYDLNTVDWEQEKKTIFYKERWFKENGIEERMIVTYSIKYALYQDEIRNRQLSRAENKLNNPSRIDSKKQNNPERFISRESITKEGEYAEYDVYTINEEKIKEEERYDGYYAITTNLEDATAEEIVSINHQRWKIEECFRIMKQELKARPVYLKRDDRIEAHFLTCFLSLVLYRFLEKKLNNEYSPNEITNCLREMNMLKMEGYGYIPTYTRTKLTDKLHKTAEFDTSKEIISIKNMRNICKMSKNR